VPSIILRPGVVCGVARDQGMTSSTTKAILAAVAGHKFTIPFGGDIGHLYVRDVANAFLNGVSKSYQGCHVFDINGQCINVNEFLALLKSEVPEADITVNGDPLPFPDE